MTVKSNDPLQEYFSMDAQHDSLVKDQAAEWFVRLRDEEVSVAERVAFETWLNADPGHLQAYQQMERLWSGLDQIDKSPKIRGNAKNIFRRALTLRHLAIAASVTIVAGFSAYIVISQGFLADYRTSPGELRTVSLEDGSILHLNTATAISSEFSPTQRKVTLYSGETYFEVAKDVERPFIVDTEIGEIQALGTAFSVKHQGDRVEVIVTESRAQVSNPMHQSTIVGAGQGIHFSDTGMGTVTKVDAYSDLAWLRGLLVFDNQPLSEVLAELDRFRHGRILIMDQSLNTFPVTGSFSIKKIDSALDTIEQTFPVRIRRFSDLVVMVFHDSSK